MSSDQEDVTSGTSESGAQPIGLGNFSVTFPGGTGPTTPNGNMIVNGAGDLFGTTQAGGTSGRGTIFEATADANGDGGNSQPTALTSFLNYSGPAGSSLSPGNLIMNASGDVFGTTETGGSGKRSQGTVFELPPKAGNPTGYQANPNVLASFNRRTGFGPENLTTDARGDLFGITTSGTRTSVFELAKTARGFRARPQVLASFRGGEHLSSNLLVTSSGIIGAATGGKAGAGEVFELEKTPRGTFRHNPTVLNSGIGVQNLATDSSGNVFAVSSAGGTNHEGAVYELGAKGSTNDLVNFTGTNGADPTGITLDGAGNIYGTTRSGGTNGYGTVYELTKAPTGYVAQNPVSFTGNTESFPGENPVGSPTLNGNFLDGTTTGGGFGGYLYGIRTASLGGGTAAANNDPMNSAGIVDDAVAAPAAAVCFAGGTRIRTTKGDVAVEALVVGDRVVTASGAVRPIKWLGHRATDCRRHPRPHEVMPIRIAAHAFAPGKPARDLYVSPGHAICVDVMGEVLVPAGVLVNGTTITQVEVERVTYWHVELDAHDIVLAEGVPAESYLEMGNRSFFAEDGVVQLAAAPDAAPGRTHADFCRPYHWRGPRVDAVRAALAARGTVEEQRLAS